MKINKIKDILNEEIDRETNTINLIASENYASREILELQGSVLTNKYAEGYPGRRYYGGCEYVDKIEDLAIKYACELFKCSYANVQPHSGSQANQAVYLALLEPGDTILGMSLDAGGHLTHGYHLNVSGQLYHSVSYGLNKDETIDFDEVERLTILHKPKLIIAGASAYSRVIDFKRFREIANKVNAYLMVDMAHIAGLVATNNHPSPFPHAHVVTSTTHKTLRGPRGGLILWNDEELTKPINRAVFPGVQGGPLMHVIAAKAQCFYEALQEDYKKYMDQVVKNTKVMAEEFMRLGFRVVSNATMNHQFTLNVKDKLGITGLDAQNILESINITVNKNAVPNDQERPKYTSGIRIGTPAITTRGLHEEDMKIIASIICRKLSNPEDMELHSVLLKEVSALCKKMKAIH